LLWQKNLRGQRVPLLLNNGKRSLPHYPFENLTVEQEYESRGFISSSFIHGLNPKEFYMHGMSGREGVSDKVVSVKGSW
jgi:DNA-directed RNA polymerase beta' subunit